MGDPYIIFFQILITWSSLMGILVLEIGLGID